jgi:hypothetical protein
MQDSGLHDQGEMFALLARQRKVFQRVAVDDEDVKKGARLQLTAEIAAIGNRDAVPLVDFRPRLNAAGSCGSGRPS